MVFKKKIFINLSKKMLFLLKKVSKSCVLIVILFIFTKCGQNEVRKLAPEINEIKVSSKFVIKLPENHKSSYLWKISGDFNEKIVKNTNSVWHGNEKGVYFHFEALSIGQTTLTFVNRGYSDTSEIKRFIVNIKHQ